MKRQWLVLALLGAAAFSPAQGFNPTGAIVIDGNSMTRENADANSFADWMQASLGAPNLIIAKVGQPSWTTAQLAARADTVIEPWFQPAYPVNVLLFWEISNALVSGRGVDGTIADVRAYIGGRRNCAAAHGITLTIGVLTAVPFYAPYDLAGDLEWQRLAVNTRVRTGDTGADFVVDIAGADPFTAPAAIFGPYYRADHVHLSQTGSRYVGELVARHPQLLKALRGAVSVR